MKLKLFRVQNFRSFLDSGWINCQDITTLAGVNEAGKSNLLKALWKLKPAFQSDNKILHTDLPRDRFDEIMESNELPVFVTAKFKFEPRDLGLLKKYFPTIKPFDSCIVSRTLSGKYIVEVPVNVPDEQKAKLHNFIIKIMPGFIYYSNYGNLDSNIYLPQMLSKFNKSGVATSSSTKRRTIKLLLLYIGITPEMLKNDMNVLFNDEDTTKLSAQKLAEITSKKEEYKQLFDEAGKRLSQEFSAIWHQGTYKFEFTFEGSNLRIWVTDEKGNRAPLEERSVGMQWFLSFFLVFTMESKHFYTNTILLLDESGMTLHSLAQKDLVANKNQIIYSTHSSFMIPTEHLNRTKIIFKDDMGHSVVNNDLRLNQDRSNAASLFPVQSAVGIEISRSILNGATPVVVINNSDQILLSAIKNYLSGKGLFQSVYDTVFVSTGVNGLDGTTQVLSEGHELPVVFLSDDAVSEKMREHLCNHSYKNCPERVFTVNQFGNFSTLEDCIPYEIFARGAGNYIAKILDSNFELDTEESFLIQLERYAEEKKYTLPDNYREEIALRVKKYFQRNYDALKITRNTKKLWQNILNALTFN